MKNKRTPFIWVVLVVLLGGVAYFFNMKQENPQPEVPAQPQTPQQAPNQQDIKNSVAANLKSKGPKQAPMQFGGPGERPLIERPQHPIGTPASKPDLSSQTLGQWYHKDSVKDVNNGK